jgi:Zn-dependent protease with chaperone function
MDGVSLERQPVRLFPMAGGIVIGRADGSEERLPFERLVLVSDLPDRTVLGRKDAPDWRLSVAPPLSARRLDRLRRARRRPGRTALVYAAVVAAIGGGGALAWYRGGAALEAVAPHVPQTVTVPLGEAIAEEVAAGKFCRTPESTAAIARLVARLLPDGGGAEPVVVRIADLPVANALAAPGGQVLLTRGLVEKASGPDEVAGVLAHELGHVEHRHATQMLLRNIGMSILLSGTGSDAAAFGDTLLMTAMSREKEREADAFALETLARAGISPAGLIAFFEREMPKEKDGKKPRDVLVTLGKWSSTHPPTPERLAAFRDAVGQAGETTPAMDAADWAALKAACGPTLPQAGEAS